MKHKDYWRKRFEQLEEAQNNKSVKYYLELEKQYKLAINSIEKDILAWYNRFAKNEGISLLEAKKLLNTRGYLCIKRISRNKSTRVYR